VHPMPQDKLLNLSLSKTASTMETFHAIFIRHSKSVLSFIYSMLQDKSQAEELCQETFIRAFRKLDSKDENTALSTWLFGIAHNVVREAVKRKYRSSRNVALSDPLADRIDPAAVRPDRRLITAELHNRIQDALWTLTEDQRLAFVLKIIPELCTKRPLYRPPVKSDF
jgi:RNA polymerase sigma-70 factor, ECF subfamily